MNSRWSAADVPRGEAYDERFTALEASGVDVHGEASFVERLFDAVSPAPGPSRGRVLDAGCGTGRVAVELARRGFDVVGVDLDPAMLDAARRKSPECEWYLADLAELDLRHPERTAERRRFDAAVLAGNVLLFLATGTEEQVLGRVADHLEPGGVVIAGFQLQPNGLTVEAHGERAIAVGLEPVALHATWDGAPFVPGGDYVVAVHRRTS